MRRVLRSGLMMTAATLATASCSLLVSTSDLTGGAASNAEDACIDGGCTEGGRQIEESGVDATTDAETGSPDAAAACPSSAILCDDFESGNLSKWSGQVQTGGGEIDVSSSEARHGTMSLRSDTAFTLPVDGSVPVSHGYVRKSFTPVTSGLLSFRAYVFIKDALKGEQTIVKILSTGSDDMNIKLSSSGVLKVDTDTAGSGSDMLGTTAAPIESWFCLEWQATIGAAGHQKLIANGKVEVDAAENTFTPNGFDEIYVGLSFADGDREQRVFFDDVVIAREPIGCPP